jgi:hypothetical protein
MLARTRTEACSATHEQKTKLLYFHQEARKRVTELATTAVQWSFQIQTDDPRSREIRLAVRRLYEQHSGAGKEIEELQNEQRHLETACASIRSLWASTAADLWRAGSDTVTCVNDSVIDRVTVKYHASSSSRKLDPA